MTPGVGVGVATGVAIGVALSVGAGVAVGVGATVGDGDAGRAVGVSVEPHAARPTAAIVVLMMVVSFMSVCLHPCNANRDQRLHPRKCVERSPLELIDPPASIPDRLADPEILRWAEYETTDRENPTGATPSRSPPRSAPVQSWNGGCAVHRQEGVQLAEDPVRGRWYVEVF